MKKIKLANTYIKENKHKVNNRPLFHLAPEIGWMNDPNGFSFFRGEYHLFYQHYPYDTIWNDMHWGHATSNDLVQWNFKPVALANDEHYDRNGCFSGSAIEKDGKLFLMYTGHIDSNVDPERDENKVIEQQCIAYSDDGIHFEKYSNNPVIGTKELPDGYMICDFRDPKVIEKDGVYYCVIVVRNAKRRGETIMFRSLDLLEWTFHASVYQTKYEDNIMLECPDLFHIDGKEVLVFSIMPCDPQYKKEVFHTAAYVVGKMDYMRGEFVVESEGILDYGNNFYAPQSTEGKLGERILIGWMQRWHQSAPPKEFGFNGMMSLPRVMSLQDGQLLQKPIPTIHQYFGERNIDQNVLLKQNEQYNLKLERVAYIKLEIKDPRNSIFQLEFNKEVSRSTRLLVDMLDDKIELNSDYGDQDKVVINRCNISNRDLTLEVYVDFHSIEIFINSGEKVLTFTAYDREKGIDLSMLALSELCISRIEYALFDKKL